MKKVNVVPVVDLETKAGDAVSFDAAQTVATDRPSAGVDALAEEAAMLDAGAPGASSGAPPCGAAPAGVTVEVHIAMTADTLRKIFKAVSDNKMARDPLTSAELDLLSTVWERPINLLHEELMRWAGMSPEQMGKWGPLFAAATVTMGVALPRIMSRVLTKVPAAEKTDGADVDINSAVPAPTVQ